MVPRPLFLFRVTSLALLAVLSVACETPGSNDDSDDDRAQPESAEEPSGPSGAATSGRADGTSDPSTCSRDALEDFASRDLPTYPERPTAVGRFLEFRDHCRGSLPDGIRGWLASIDEDAVALPEPGSRDGMAERVESFCPPALETVPESIDPENDRLNGLYRVCELAELDFAAEDVFEEATGWRAATAAAAVFEWLRESGADEELARETAKWLAGMGTEAKLGPRDLGVISQHHPDLRLPVSNIDDASADHDQPLVLDQTAVWRNGEAIVELHGASGDRETLARHLRRDWKPSTEHTRSVRELYVALDGRAPFALLRRLFAAAVDAEYREIQMLTFHKFPFDAAGSLVDPADVEGHFAMLPIRRARQNDAAIQNRIDGRIHITRRGHDIEGPDSPMPPRGGCPDDGPTVCLADPDADDPADRYDWLELYRAAADIHEAHSSLRAIELTASDDLPVRIWIKSAAAIFHVRKNRDVDTLNDTGPELNREGNARWMLRPALTVD